MGWNYWSIPKLPLLKFRNGNVILPHTLLAIWLLIHAGIKDKPCQLKPHHHHSLYQVCAYHWPSWKKLQKKLNKIWQFSSKKMLSKLSLQNPANYIQASKRRFLDFWHELYANGYYWALLNWIAEYLTFCMTSTIFWMSWTLSFRMIFVIIYCNFLICKLTTYTWQMGHGTCRQILGYYLGTISSLSRHREIDLPTVKPLIQVAP